MIHIYLLENLAHRSRFQPQIQLEIHIYYTTTENLIYYLLNINSNTRQAQSAKQRGAGTSKLRRNKWEWTREGPGAR